MTNGIDRRAQIDIETTKALVLINGGGAIALLSILPSIMVSTGSRELTTAVLVAVPIFMLGLVSAVLHNHYRRKCSLHYEQHDMRPPRGRMLGYQLSEPTVCWISTRFLWLSLLCFIFAGSYVAIVGVTNIDKIQARNITP